MTLRFGLALVGFLGACSLVSVGCGDDDPTDGGGSNKGGKGGSSAGEGGEGASGAAPGTGGRGGTAGTGGGGGTAGAGGGGGTAGAGGRGGTAGAGGTDATGGLAGDAGGGPIGGEGGFGGEGGGMGGAGGAGNAGEGGAGGVPDMTADRCSYECVDDDDCARGTDTSNKCNPTRKRCENPNLVCDSHDDCLAMASSWNTACANDGGCSSGFGEVCVDVGGRGRCALPPDMTFGCLFAGGSETPMPRFGATGSIVVCANEAGRCNDVGQCFIGCTEPAQQCSLLRGRGPNCNATSGLCECTSDTQCTAMGVSRCNTTTHLCECGSDTDCPATQGADVCVSGRCGCSGTNVCPASTFPLARGVCE